MIAHRRSFFFSFQEHHERMQPVIAVALCSFDTMICRHDKPGYNAACWLHAGHIAQHMARD